MNILILIFLLSSSLFAQDPVTYFRNFDSKAYSLKAKGVKDISFDIESNRLTKQVNEQQIFGEVKQLLFRVYWTSGPQRLSLEVVGLPEGFKELKEELKLNILPYLEVFLPRTFEQRFQGYNFTKTNQAREFLAKDSTGIAPIPSFLFKFDHEDKLVEIVANKPVGSVSTIPSFEKKNFSQNLWILTKEVTTMSENSQSMNLTKDYSYTTINGVGLLDKIKVTSEHKSNNKTSETLKFTEEVTFSNYRVNEGVAMRYFLGESKKNTLDPVEK